MPNRMIKESIRTSKKVNTLSDFQFRVWLYLITYVDDFGRGSADPELLKGLVFPRRKGITEQQISEVLHDLANIGMITLYDVDEESYFYFPNWGKHQRIQTKRSKFPDPPKSTVNHGEPPPKTKPSVNQNENQTETSTNSREAAVSPLGTVMTFYAENISQAMPSSVVTQEITGFLADMETEVVLHAMQIAAEADKHDWRYIKAILNRYRASGLKTMEAVSADEAKHKGKRGGKWEYTDDPLEGWDKL